MTPKPTNPVAAELRRLAKLVRRRQDALLENALRMPWPDDLMPRGQVYGMGAVALSVSVGGGP